MTIPTIWTEKYRPRTVAECILPKEMKATFQSFVDAKNLPNLLLVGNSGIGKTTVAKAILDELDCNSITINCSLNRGIDLLRGEISSFASSVSFKGGRKFIILDEFDNATVDLQKALRNFTETFSTNCGFIFTANYANKVIPALHSRCSVVKFEIPKEEKQTLAAAFLKRIIEILKEENVEYDKKSVVNVILAYFPDFRRVLNELQRHSMNGKIANIVIEDKNASVKELIDLIKSKDFTKLRQWCAENKDGSVFQSIYSVANEYFHPSYIPVLVVTIAKYDYQQAFVANPEINVAAFLVEIMAEAMWK